MGNEIINEKCYLNVLRVNGYDLEELTVTIHLSLVSITAPTHRQSRQIQVVCGGPAWFIRLKINAFCNSSRPRQHISIKVLSKRRRKEKRKRKTCSQHLTIKSFKGQLSSSCGRPPPATFTKSAFTFSNSAKL